MPRWFWLIGLLTLIALVLLLGWLDYYNPVSERATLADRNHNSALRKTACHAGTDELVSARLSMPMTAT